MKEKPSPNSFIKDGISSSIKFFSIFSEIFRVSKLDLIIIGFLTKSVTLVSSLFISLFLVLSSNLSYSFDLILSLSSLLLKFCFITIFIY